MQTFTYKAVRANGEVVTGVVKADSREQAFHQLGGQRLQPIRLEEGVGAGDTPQRAAEKASKAAAISFSGKLSRRQVILFTEELADLLDAGMQLEPAMRIMEHREELSTVQPVIVALRNRLRDGSSFSNALKGVNAGFDELYCSLVAAGETSGSLPQILKRQTAYLAAMDELRSRVIQSLIYPAFLVGSGFVLMTVFMTVLVPELTSLMSKTGKAMPLPTQVLVSTSHWLLHDGWILIVLVVGGISGFYALIQHPSGRNWWDRFQTQIPLAGAIISARFYAQLAYTLATMLENGIPLLSGLNLMKNASTNRYWNRLLALIQDRVSEGGSLSRAMKRSGDFPPAFLDLVNVGEQTGDLPAALKKVSQRFDRELTQKIQRLTAMIQPTIIFVMALVVGTVAYSIMTGIFQSMSALKMR